MVRTKTRRKRARLPRVPMAPVSAPNERWSMDFVCDRLLDGRWLRVQTVIDQYTRECVLLLADQSLTGEKVAKGIDVVLQDRPAPQSITVDNGSEFTSRAVEAWAYQRGIQLDFIRPGRPVENGLIESFNGRLRDECLNVEIFFTLEDVRAKLANWQRDYNQERPHSALNDQPPHQLAADWRISHETQKETSEILERVS